MHRFTRPFATRARGTRRFRRTVAVLTTLALGAGLAGLTGATAATTLNPSPTETGASGPIVRDDVLKLDVSPGARAFYRLLAFTTFAEVEENAIALGYNTHPAFGPPCLGNNTAPGGRNSSPRSQVELLDEDGVVLASAASPAKWLGLTAPAALADPATPPNDEIFLGGAWSTEFSLAGLPAGIYTVKTTITNMVKSANGPCAIGTPNSATGASTFNSGPVIESWTFQYVPWQQTFTDLLGAGKVLFDTVPKQFQFEVAGAPAPSPVIDGTQAMKLYSLPTGASFSLSIPNPGACGSDPLSCLPDTAISCDPADGCQPRLATINHQGTSDKLVGLFDLETKAFAAIATTGGHTRVLVSAGTAVDGILHDLLDQVTDTAGQLGLDLPALLDTDIDLNLSQPDGTTKVLRVNLLKGLEFFTLANGPATGLGIAAPITVGAGVISHTSAWFGRPDPAYTAPDGTLHSPYGYDVAEATALPAVPSLPGLAGVLVPPGKIQHIKSRIPAGSGVHTVALGADTHADPETGLPVHLPLISTPSTNVVDDGIDFIGRALVVQTDACSDVLGPMLCLGFGTVLGTGVAVFGDSPLPVDFGSIPLVWGDELGLGGVMAQVDDVVNDVLTNPAVQDLVNTVLSAVPALPIPGAGGGTPAEGGLLGLPGLGLPGLGLPDLGLPVSGGLLGLPLGNLPLGNALSNLLGFF